MYERIEAVARALCKSEGKDPDQKTRLPGGRVGFQASIGDASMDGPLLWETYKAEAEKFVVAIEAMQPFLDRAKRW
jgi:hypothetical protein